MTIPITPMPARRPAEPKTYPVCSFKKACELIESKCGDVQISERHGSGSNKVVILPEANQELTSMISYGRRSPMNAKEQKYAGYGHILVDDRGNTVTIVKHFIEIQTMNRNSVGASNLGPNGENNPGLDFLEYHREEFLKLEAKYNMDAYGYVVDPFMKLCGSSEFVLEGHTHPDLGCFYSQTDRVSGTARAASAPICIFVCDPIRKEMLGSIGRSFSDAEVVVYERVVYNPMETDVESLIPPSDEIARLTSQCLHTRGYSGNIKIHTRFDGRSVMKIKLVIPSVRGSTR